MGATEENGPVFSPQLREQLLQLQRELDKEQTSVGDLRRRVATIEKEKLAIISRFNGDVVELQNAGAKMRSQLEDCKAAKCGLEYELAAAKQQIFKERNGGKEKEQHHLEENRGLKQENSDLRLRLAKAEDDRDKTVGAADRKEVALSDALLAKEAELESSSKELELTKVAKSELEKLSDTREKQIVELERKMAQLESECQRLSDKGKLQRTESDWMLQKEKQIKQELDAAIEKSKRLEANIEAERAAHLETKFNSEIVQLRVRDVEAVLEEAKTASNAKDAVVIDLKAEIEAMSKVLQEEKKSAAKVNHKWQKTSDELTDSRNHVGHQESLINELSKEIDAHQAHFSSLKEELDKTKSNQKQLEGNYSSWLKDLEITVFNYWFTLKGRRFAEEEFGTAASATAATKAFTATGKLSSPRSPSPKTLVEGVKVLLGEFALLTRDSAVVDETLQKKEAKITELQQTLGRREHDQDQADRHVTDLADELSTQRSEVVRLSSCLETESSERRALESEFSRVAEASRKAEDEKLHFLAESLAKLVALIPNAAPLEEQLEKLRGAGVGGRGSTDVGSRSNSALSSSSSWSQLSNLTKEHMAKVGVVIKALRKKIKGLEDELAKEEELKIHLTTNQEETLKKMAEASTGVEERAAEEKRDLEEHFSQLLQKVHDRAKAADSEAQSAVSKLDKLESSVQNGGKEIHLLQSQLDQVEKDRSCLLAAVALLSGILFPQVDTISALASQRRLAEEISNQSTIFRRHACILVETLASEFPSPENDASEGASEGEDADSDGKPRRQQQQRRRRRRGFSGILTFRRAVLVVLATNRLRHLNLVAKSKKQNLLIISEFPRKGKRSSLLIGRKDATPAWTRTTSNGGNGKNGDSSSSSSNNIENKLANWLTSTDLQTGVILALQPLLEKVDVTSMIDCGSAASSKKYGSRNASTRATPGSGLTEIASFACVQMMQRVNAHFLAHEDNVFTGDSSSRGGNLCWRLGHGLSRALSSVHLRPRLRLASAQEIMSSLQHHLLAITQRLHTSELERKELRTQLSQLSSRLGDYKGVQEMATSLKDQTNHLQRELQGTVKADQFASVCGELQATLAREQQTQKLLSHQASRIQNLTQESGIAAKQLEQSQAAVRQMTAQLADLKKDSRKKDADFKDHKKSTDCLESERQLLLANVKDAEKALTTVSKDKDRLLAFIKSTDTTLQRAMKHLKLLSESGVGGSGVGGGDDGGGGTLGMSHFDAGVLPVNLSQLLSTLNVHEPTSPSSSSQNECSELRATRKLVNLFVDVYQAAFVKMSSIRQELQANQQHVRRLKAELSDACARGGVGNVLSGGWGGRRNDGGGGGSSSSTGVFSGTHRTTHRNGFQPLDEDSENSLNQRDEFVTPVKSGPY